MSFARVIYALASVAGLGMMFGAGLAVAARVLAVKKDRRLEQLEEALPGLNCGACGYAGCSAYAQAVYEGTAPLDLCTPGGESAAAALASLMGQELDVKATKTKMVTQVHCRGGEGTAKYKFDYQGVQDCNALHALYGGDKECPYGCLGLGSCVRVCPVDAIDWDEQGLVWVDKDTCISCGKCVDVCPTGVMQWVPYDADLFVACNSKDNARTVKKYCSVGCIGCKLCEKKSPEGGYKVTDFLSRIDHTAEGDRQAGADACPTHCIIPNEKT